MKQLLLFLPALLFITISLAQSDPRNTGAIQGKILTRDGKPAAAVTLVLKDFNRSVLTDDSGLFVFNKLIPGKYTVLISCTGLTALEKTIPVITGQTARLDIILEENAKRLDEVIISNHKPINRQILSLAKSPVANMDLPQTTGMVNHVVIADQQAIRVGEAIRNVSGVSLTQARLGVNETYTARGYSIGISGGAGSILKNGLITNTAGMPEAATLESIEVMKGSSAMLYGNVSGGLVVNLVTKKPKFQQGGEVKMQAGSYSQYKPIVDIFGPVTKKMACRVVGTYENDKSFRDVVHTKRFYVNPSLLYKFNEKTSLNIQGEWLSAKLTPDFGIGTLDSGRVLPAGIPISRFINVLWAYNNVNQRSGSFTLTHTLNDQWQWNADGAVQQTDVDSYGAGLPNAVSKTGDWNRTLARAHSIENDYTLQTNLKGQFTTGKIKHQLLLGSDYTRIVTQTDAFTITSNGVQVTIYDKINLLNANLYTPRNDIPDATITTTVTAPTNRAGVYIQDLVTLLPKIKMLGGVRWSYNEIKQTRIYTAATQNNSNGTTPTAAITAYSPKLAVLYQPSAATSFFASYSNNFTTNTGTDIYGQLLKPSLINQYELGIKNNFWNDQITANLSIYRIVNSNLAQQAAFKADGTLNSDATVKELKGQTTSDGVEADITATFSSHCYLIAGYSYNYMRFTKTSGAKGANIEGEQLVNNPRHTANCTAFYTFTRKKLRGLKLGMASFYTGNRLGGYNNTVGQTQTGSRLLPLKGFVTTDIFAGYKWKKATLQCRISNLFNTMNFLVHDNYSITPINPRQFTATVGYVF